MRGLIFIKCKHVRKCEDIFSININIISRSYRCQPEDDHHCHNLIFNPFAFNLILGG